MNNFTLKEIEGRTIFKEFLDQVKNAKNWNPTKGEFDYVDGFFELGDKKIVVEIKTRDIKYSNYASHLIQIDKFMNLTKAKLDNNCKTGIYVNIFGNNLIYLYDIKDINNNNCMLVNKYVNRTTAIDKGKTYKLFYDIPVRYAQIFKKDNGVWKRIN